MLGACGKRPTGKQLCHRGRGTMNAVRTKPASQSQDGRAMQAEDITDADYATLAAFRLALRQFAAFSEAAAKAAGLTPRQHQALLAIKGAAQASPNGLGVGEIAKALLIRHNSAVELVDRLADAGLVRRQPDPSDGRRSLVVVTEQ